MIWKNDLTYQVLQDVPESRSDDRRLIEEVWKKCGLHLTEEQRYIFYASPSPETIRRTRQKINEIGQFKASPEVQQARLNFEETVRKEIKS